MLAAVFLLATTLTDADCLGCHDQLVAPKAFEQSVHGPLGCTGCHDEIHDYPHPAKIAKPQCATCHEEPAQKLGAGAHARSGGPSCLSCHGSPHTVRAATDPQSPVAKANLPQTCGTCHASPQFQASHNLSIARPVEAYRASVHGRAIHAGRLGAASCSDCHGSHDILPARDARSPINRWAVPKTCGACHAEILKAYESSVHGRAVSHGLAGAPVCTDCHGEHSILAPSEAGSLVNPARVSAVTCGRCHGDERLAEKYNLPRDKVPAYEDSFHGLALRSGRQHVANCASCHGVHNILPSKDPASTIHPANLARTCGACHDGAGTQFAVGPVHVGAGTATEHPITRGVRWGYLVLIPLTIGLMLLHNGLDLGAKMIRRRATTRGGPELPRMGRHFRIAHGLTVASFPVLVVTGFALKFPEAWWARPLLVWESHIAARGLIHRAAGVVLLLSLAYHVGHLLLVRRDRRFLTRIWPRWTDLTDAIGVVRWNLGLTKTPPKLGIFSYAEKAEYWAYLWGTAVMAVTGFILWFADFSLRHLPKWVSDVATAVHYYEAILATAAIIVWHFYMVIFDPEVYPMESAWLTGRVSAEHLKHHRPGYYRALVRLVTRRKQE